MYSRLCFSNPQERFSTYHDLNHLFKPVEKFTNLLLSSLCSSAFKAIQSLLATKL